MLRDKFIFEAFCKRLGISTPNNIGMINDGSLYLISKQEFVLLEDIIQIEMNAFLKRKVSYGGGMGNDIIPLMIKKGNIYMNDTLVEVEEFINFIGYDTWIIQERIMNQHPALSKFHANSINTIRIVTVKDGKTIRLLSAFLRIGVNGRHADNQSSGGIVVGVDIKSGTLVKWGLYKPGFGTKADRHPNTDIVFENYKIPLWDEIIDVVKHAHRLFYGLHSIGWDVCVTDDGIKLIEGNDNWDTIDLQFYQGAKDEYLKYFKN